jgi:thiol-disulfide isomerase/thioredoxin
VIAAVIVTQNVIATTGKSFLTGTQINSLVGITIVERTAYSITPGSNKLVMVFWAPWCNSCKKLMPKLERASLAWQNKGTKVLGVGIGGDSDRQRQFLSSTRVSFPNLTLPSNILETFRITRFPTLVVLDEQLVVRAHFQGFIQWDYLEQALEK